MSHLAAWTRMVPGARVMSRNPALFAWRGTVARDVNGFCWTWIQQPLGGINLVFVAWDDGREQWHIADSLMVEERWTEQWRASR